MDFSSMDKQILWKSMGTSNGLVTHILQNMFFCVQQLRVSITLNTVFAHSLTCDISVCKLGDRAEHAQGKYSRASLVSKVISK